MKLINSCYIIKHYEKHGRTGQRNRTNRKIADKNIKGEKLRKDGKISEAKKLFEENIKLKADTPATYRNLAIIYRSEKDKDNEKRVLKEGLLNVNPNNKKHYKWIKDRLSKIK